MASNQAAKGRKPDFKLTCMDPDSEARSGPLGAAWKNEDGSIHIKLGPGTCLTHGLRVMLWPADEGPAPTRQQQGTLTRKNPSRPAKGYDDMDDDIPF